MRKNLWIVSLFIFSACTYKLYQGTFGRTLEFKTPKAIFYFEAGDMVKYMSGFNMDIPDSFHIREKIAFEELKNLKVNDTIVYKENEAGAMDIFLRLFLSSDAKCRRMKIYDIEKKEYVRKARIRHRNFLLCKWFCIYNGKSDEELWETPVKCHGGF